MRIPFLILLTLVSTLATANVRYSLTQDGQPVYNPNGKPLVFDDPVEAGIALAIEAAGAPESLFEVTASGSWSWQTPGELPPLELTALTWRSPGGTAAALDHATVPQGPVVFQATTSDNVARVEWVNAANPKEVWYTSWQAPFKWSVDLSQVPPGEYGIMVRLVGHDGRVRAYRVTVTVDKALGQTFAVTVEWDPPQAREDGTPLTTEELAGYTLRVQSPPVTGPVHEQFIPGGATRAHEMTLSPAMYQVQLVAVDTQGLRSDPSDPLVFTL